VDAARRSLRDTHFLSASIAELPDLERGSAMSSTTLSNEDLSQVDAAWRAANYLTVGQIYLQANPLLTESLTPDHIKPRLLGHWGTSPGLNMLYVHLNRMIRARARSTLFVAGPGPSLALMPQRSGPYPRNFFGFSLP
jgi:xylulose-5-phosphate/fructose-6-phosphate phosphoketolase